MDQGESGTSETAANVVAGLGALNADFKLKSEVLTDTGTPELLIHADGLTIDSGSGALSATNGADTFALDPHSVEAITATGHQGETFEYEEGFGQSAIKGFAATGASHDVIQFQIAAFNYLNGSTDQQQDAIALLSHAVKQAANLEFSDSTGDALILDNASKATLAANLSDFRFV